MPFFDSQNLLKSLQQDVQQLTDTLTRLNNTAGIDWNKQPAAGKWSAAQVIEHLNSYNRYYLPEIARSLQTGKIKGIVASTRFKAGWFGNYFTKLMQPGKDGKIGNKMNAPKDHTPIVHLDATKVITDFLAGQSKLISYLKEAEQTDIGKMRVPISISKFIKLKLGDTFRFLIAHQQRHFLQLKNTLNSIS